MGIVILTSHLLSCVRWINKLHAWTITEPWTSPLTVTVRNAETQSASKHLPICSKIAMAALMQKMKMTFALVTQSSQKLYSISYIIISGDVLGILHTTINCPCLQYVTHLNSKTKWLWIKTALSFSNTNNGADCFIILTPQNLEKLYWNCRYITSWLIIHVSLSKHILQLWYILDRWANYV